MNNQPDWLFQVVVLVLINSLNDSDVYVAIVLFVDLCTEIIDDCYLH